ncbi:type I restriction modification DNA specificity domain protein [Selenomonas sp. oral taxon 892 str. F0426]|uniref:restriction endonuclease subunit S n=1 Tax=Selenomonas sp. oral taxon 892 TaxID=1321785 RepID=UPI0003AD6D95|nr:restriction endonuclease subunit S [Selenomonas sp. oral taxon 892]ERJ95075.1 type I restriction modification DNA specificity domain protein [Selenomonas sp. oral taxon 892 str. F0426]
MDTETLRKKILDLAIRGKLVPQDPNDEPASVLLERIRAQKAQMVKDGKLKAKDVKNDTIIYVGEDNLHYEKFADGTIKCIEDEIPFEVPESWAWAHLSDIAQILNGDRGQNYPAKNKLQDTGIPFVSASNIESGVVISNNLLCMTEAQYKSLGAGKLITNDIVYCIRGSLGKCGFFTMSKGAISSSLVIVRPFRENNVIRKYLFLYLNASLAESEIKKYDNGSAQPNLAAKDFARFLIPVPPLDELDTIVKKTDNVLMLVEQITNNKESIKNIISLTTSKILDLAIHGKLVPQNDNDEPASMLLERIRAEKEELIKQGKIKRDKRESVIYRGTDNSYYERFADGSEKCIDEEIPFEIPDSWTWVRLGHIIKNIQYGLSSSAEISGTCHLLRITDIQNGKVDWDTVPYTSTNNLDKYLLHINDILFARTGATVGKSFLVTQLPCDSVYASYLIRVQLLDNIWIQYIHKFFNSNSYWAQIRDKMVGVGQPNCNGTSLKELLIPFPPHLEQKRITLCMKDLINKINSMIDYIS